VSKRVFNKTNLLKKIILGIIFLLLIIFAWQTLQSHIFNVHFVDEDENIMAGYYLAQGQKLYGDIFSHKQPMPAVYSSLVNKVFKPDSLFLLIKKHREAVFFYSALWWLVFLYFLGEVGLAFSLVIEIVKRFFLGDLFLGESLVIYPLVFVIAYLWKKEFTKVNTSGWERNLFIFSLILICFQLITLIPFSAIVIFYLLVKERFQKKTILSLTLIFALLFLVFAPFVDYQDYFLNTKAALASHYLEDTLDQGLPRLFSYSFFKPVVALIAPVKGDFGFFIKVLSFFYFLSLFYLLVKEKKRLFLIFTFFLLGTTSLRLVDPQAVLYEGFHGFPWLAAIVMLTLVQIKRGVLLNWEPAKRRILVFLSLVLVLLIFTLTGQFFFREYFRQPDPFRDFQVHFSYLQGVGGTIKALSSPDDRLMVIPVEQLLYFESGLKPQNRFLYTYEWIFWNEELKKEIKANLEKNPPAFVYYDYTSVGEDAKAVFDPIFKSFVQLRHGSDPSPLLISEDELVDLDPEQIERIKNFGFFFPEKE